MIRSYLNRVFRMTELENRRVILAVLRGQTWSSMARPKSRRLLDLGCGDGSFTIELGRAAGIRDLHGIEFVPSFAERAEVLGVKVRQTDLGQRFPYDDGEFEVVHSNQVIEHMVDTDHFIRETRRVLKPGGVAIMSTNNLASWHNVASLVLGWQPLPAHVSDEVLVGNPIDPYRGTTYDAPGQTHKRVFTGRALHELAEYHSLRMKTLSGVGYYPLPITAARVLARLDPRHAAFLVAVAVRE